MSMFILNSQLSERYPTVLQGLIYTYPFDGEKHCCINDIRYAKVLSIKNGSDDLYTYFQNKGSIITNIAIDLNNDDIPIVEGQYNIVAIDNKNDSLSEDVIKKIKDISAKSKTSFLINSNNLINTYYNYGGSYCYISPIINEENIKDAITKSSLFNERLNDNIYSDCINLNDGYFVIPWDNRLNEFSISLDVGIDIPSENIGIACIANNATPLISILYNMRNKRFLLKQGTAEASYETIKEVDFIQKAKISITKYGDKIKVFFNDKLCLAAQVTLSTKGNKLIIGKNTIANTSNSASIRISNLAVYDRCLDNEDISTLNRGRLIFA